MTDLKPGFNPLFLREEDLREGMELLFFAYRDFVEEADQVLRRLGLGRAHHRALYFIGRHPGLTVSELLALLRVTKQSLSRVLADLARLDLIAQKPGLRDRRKRHLTLTQKGADFDRELMERQRTVLARAYREAGAEAVSGFRKVLVGLIGADGDRRRFGTAGHGAGEPRAPASRALGRAAPR